MATGARYKVPFRRRRKGKTNYHRRLRMLRSGMTRAVVRRTNKKMIVQFVNFYPEGDKVVAQATSDDLKKLGWKGSGSNVTAAYLTGLLAGKRAQKASVDSAVLDIGLQTPIKGSNVFSSLKGILDAGVLIPHSEEVLPDDERISGAVNKNESTTKEYETVKESINKE